MIIGIICFLAGMAAGIAGLFVYALLNIDDEDDEMYGRRE